eukprot:TRINITY_DN5406_c1_g3_i1.p1 TRINITY_DN5406_c1_g3~~TRINITY_DN5406_c1_g3_i1.p1  ORF type:complete len:484 (+),score=58.18 TRINITY_DN5406_c1_g3_i1:306-1757(+)
MACSWYQTAEGIGAEKEVACVLDGKQIVLHASVLLVVLACCAAACFYQRHEGLLEEERTRILKEGLATISSLQHPMCLISLNCFLELSVEDVACCYEGARDEGQLLFLDSLEGLSDFKASGRKIAFFSYNWLSWSRLGPNEKQLTCMQGAARKLCGEQDIDHEFFYIWLDVLSIPQANDKCKSLAVESLYFYASQSNYCVAVCPTATHEESGEMMGAHSFASRLWCRLELMAHVCSNGLQGMYYCAAEDELTPITRSFIDRVVRIFDGELTCCRQRHPGGARCDRELLVPVALGMYADLLVKHQEERLPQIAVDCLWPLFISCQRNQVFPESFLYAHPDGGYTRRLLFGSMMDKVPALVLHKRASSRGTDRRLPALARSDDDSSQLALDESPASGAGATVKQRPRLPRRQSVLRREESKQKDVSFSCSPAQVRRTSQVELDLEHGEYVGQPDRLSHRFSHASCHQTGCVGGKSCAPRHILFDV